MMKKLLFVIIFVSNAYAATLDDVVDFALKNAPQFSEENFTSQAQLATLRKVMAIYDTQLTVQTSYADGLSSSTLADYTTRSSSLGLQKNLGAGVSVGAGYEAATSLNSSGDRYQSAIKLEADIDLLSNFLGKQDRSSVLVAEKDQQKIKILLKQTRESLVLGVVNKYLSTLRLEQLLVENRELYKNIEILAKATAKKNKIGAADRRSLLQMQAKLLNSRMNILELERQLENSYNQLKTLVGGKRFSDLTWPRNGYVGFSDGESLYLESLRIEHDKLALEKSSAAWSRLPSLKLSLSYQYGDIDTAKYSYDMEENGRGVGLYLTFPIGNTSAREEYQSSKLKLLANEYTLKREKEEFEDEKEEYKQAVKNYQSQIALAGKAIDLQKERYQKEIKAYSQGRSGINDVNTAQNDLINAQITSVEKKVGLYQFSFGQKHLVGRLEKVFESRK